MSRTEYFECTPLVEGEQREWSPTAKLILAFILGLLVLSPAILGAYWEMVLPK
jgi:hypothetical protein